MVFDLILLDNIYINIMKSKFKRINSFEIRHQLFLNIKDRYPNKIYVIFEKGEELFNS